MQSQVSLNSDRFTTISLISTSVSILGCLYVLIRLYRRDKISVENKHPAYFAISYLICSIMQIMNLFINNSTVVQPGILYGILGKFYSIFLTVNLLLVTFLEFSTMTKINERININTGKYDVYMWQGMILLSWAASIFGINRYEPLELRYVHRFDTGFEYFSNVFLILLVLLGTITYYFELRKILHKIFSREFINRKIENWDHMNPNAIRSCLLCLIPFMIQWYLILFYNVLEIIGSNDFLLSNILLIIAVNIGGIGHAISFFIYERNYLSTPTRLQPIIPSYGTLTTNQLMIVTM